MKPTPGHSLGILVVAVLIVTALMGCASRTSDEDKLYLTLERVK